MIPNGEVFTPTDTVPGGFGTFDPATGAPITLAGTPSLRLERFRSGAWSEITGAGITLRVDEDDTGRHEYEIDLDDSNIAAAAGDFYKVAINVGTVDGNSVVGVCVGYFYVLADGLTAGQIADLLSNLGFAPPINTTVVDASPGANEFEIDSGDDVGSVTLLGVCFFPDGTALAGESRLCTLSGTTMTTHAPTSVPAGLGPGADFSGPPTNGDALVFTHMRG